VWNVAKGKNRKFAKTFERLTHAADIILVQEYLDDPSSRGVLESSLGQEAQFILATSFEYADGARTGVLTASQCCGGLYDEVAIVTQDLEPFVHTPKASLITRMTLTGGETMMVINTHGMNRAGFDAFSRQIEALVEIVRAHTGPVLWGGDFNTNSKEKWIHLMNVTHSLGLTPVTFIPDGRTKSKLSRLYLDHIFIRDLFVTSAESPPDVSGSDHQPMLLTLALSN